VPEPIEVLVVGAGPVGLTAAHELTRRGVAVRIVDAAAGPAVTSRAIATHPRTLETYDAIGLLDEMLARARKITAFTVFANGRRLARLDADYSASPTRYPFTITIDQVSTEEVLRTALSKLGVEIEWGLKLTALTQDEERATVTLERAGGGTETVTAPWVIGADGGHSAVRKILQLPLIGESNETWLLADAQVQTELPANSIYLIRAEGTMLMMAPMPGERRWRMLDTVDTTYGGDADMVAERFARKLTAGLGHPVTVESPSWVSVFTAQQRMVPSMRDRRVFVAGDAAHVHSPASGQGMNTGIQEAYNLSWKLASVIHGHAAEPLLETYSAERVPIGQTLLGSTKAATKLVALKNAMAGLALPIVFGVASKVTPIRKKMQREALGRVAGLNIGYVGGPLTRAAAEGPGPRPGERSGQVLPDRAVQGGWPEFAAELRDLRWTLLACETPQTGPVLRQAAAAHAALLSVRTVGDGTPADGTDGIGEPAAVRALPDGGGALRTDLGLAPGGWILVRPDGYVAARGQQLTAAALEAALAPGLGRAPAAPRQEEK
jgi:6-methylpretetramide 4-monooxygenase / 4-hydroxy-6-methylpretetramide 12a-monooxygenase